MSKLTEAQINLFRGKNFAHVATVMPDGSPQVSPVWVDYDGTHVVFNTEMHRVKPRNLKLDPRIAVSVHDQANPYNFVQVRGRVVEMTTEDGEAGIDAMAKKYLGQDKYPWAGPGDVRVNVRVAIESVSGQG
jgi:PPOX class probable F420-dependent enzyme